MDASDPIGLLEQTLAELQTSKSLSPDCRRWLISGLVAWLEEKNPLEEALGLNRAKRNARLYARRNHHLRSAWRHLEGTPWARSIDLQRELQRFETVLWPTWRIRPEPPAGASALRTELFLAMKACLPPRALERLHDICRAGMSFDG